MNNVGKNYLLQAHGVCLETINNWLSKGLPQSVSTPGTSRACSCSIMFRPTVRLVFIHEAGPSEKWVGIAVEPDVILCDLRLPKWN